ncbi:hypothetical protein [Priestia abyssalis]|uniref:hypothetical protein n=1 Tax=Priestia abyssalis TaxID=1221450 RepID=UPI0011175731|nr:hypothetical protein [Priestia abyssalis]
MKQLVKVNVYLCWMIAMFFFVRLILTREIYVTICGVNCPSVLIILSSVFVALFHPIFIDTLLREKN